MRISFLLACLTALATAGCHHGERRCGCQQAQGCYQSCSPGGCAPQAEGGCVPGRVQVPCIDQKAPAPATVDRVPQPATKPLIDEVKHTPPSKFGRANDFSWLMGQLRRVHVNGGSWKIRYAPIDVQDKWGGSVILSEDVRIDAFKDGDFVYVEGELLAKRPTVYLAGPLYRISTIRPLTVADSQKARAAQLQGTSIRK